MMGFSYEKTLRKCFIELIKNIKGFKQMSVGEYVYDHYIYFRNNLNFNRNDCCNLTLKDDFKELQLKLF